MKEFMMIFRNERKEGAETPSAQQMQAVLMQWQQWIKEIASEGKFGGTNRLLSEGKTLKPNNVVTDGPFIEAKEMVGGYLIVKANSLEEAVKIAKSCPNLIYGGDVEVRSVMSIDGDPSSDKFLQPKND
jgi:hypothetical protein